MELPKHWISRMEEQLGDEGKELLAAMQQRAVTSVRVNPAKAHNLTFGKKVPWHPCGYYLDERPVFTLDPLFHAGAYYVQEASSMFLREALVQSVDLAAPLTVLDMCAAPGGKSTLLLSGLNADSLLLANEIVPSRVPSLRHNLTKWGYPNYMVSNHHPDDFSSLKGFFDVVVVDAPCSGEGLFRKDDKAIREWSPEHAWQCAIRQQNIIDSAFPLLKPGGVLLYSTCTFNPEENEKNIARWLEKYPLEIIPLDVPESWGILTGKYGYHFFPHRLRGEGFFLSSLRNTETGYIRHKVKPVKGLSKLNKDKSAAVERWIDDKYELNLFQKGNGDLVGIPENLLEATSVIANALKKRSVGVKLGALKGGKLVPSHQLSQNQVLNKTVPKMELNKDEALRFLKKEEFTIPENSSPGWKLVSYNGTGLGWAKNLQNRINNYLPNEYRIKMALPK